VDSELLLGLIAFLKRQGKDAMWLLRKYPLVEHAIASCSDKSVVRSTLVVELFRAIGSVAAAFHAHQGNDYLREVCEFHSLHISELIWYIRLNRF
jgi:hypothetical protein